MKRRTENGERKTFSFQLSALLLLLLVSSCTSKKKLVSPMAHAASYEWMSAKMNGELTMENGETALNSQLSTLSFTGTLRMRRDSTIWISASALMGIENLRALITQDSVILINRMEQTYLAEPFSAMEETMGTPSFREVQSTLLGNGSSEHVVIQYGPYTAKIHYSDIHWDEPTIFPMKINKKYERMKLKP